MRLDLLDPNLLSATSLPEQEPLAVRTEIRNSSGSKYLEDRIELEGGGS